MSRFWLNLLRIFKSSALSILPPVISAPGQWMASDHKSCLLMANSPTLMSSSLLLIGTGLNKDDDENSSFFDEAWRALRRKPELFDAKMLRLSRLTRVILDSASELSARRRCRSIWNHCFVVLNIYFEIFLYISYPMRFCLRFGFQLVSLAFEMFETVGIFLAASIDLAECCQ